MKPFRDAIEVLSGEQYCTLALASPVLHLIRRNIEASDIFEDVVLKYRSRCFDVQSAKSFVMRVQAYLVAQFCNRFADMPVCVIAASVLRPAFSRMKFLGESEMLSIAVTSSSRTAESPVSSDGVQADSPSRRASVFDQLVKLGGDEDDGSSLHETKEEITLELACIDEFKTYLKMSRGFSKDSGRFSLRWWNRHRAQLKRLSPVARKWLGCVASSVPSERAFSSSGNTVTSQRAALGQTRLGISCLSTTIAKNGCLVR